MHTSLGEESAEAMVGIGSFSLLSQETIRLDNKLEPVEIEGGGVKIRSYLNTVLEAVKL